jgi:hypothetical protein
MINYEDRDWIPIVRDLSVTRPCFLFIRCQTSGPHQSSIRIKAMGDSNSRVLPAPGKIPRPRKLSVPRRVQG